MSKKDNNRSSVGKSLLIDQRAIKIFLDWVPDHWLARKQDPDFFVDFLVELVANGEPTGLNFAAQVKGFETAAAGTKKMSYAFKTKHLKYYRDRSQNPVFLFLINVSTREGYWLFAQKHLLQKVSLNLLNQQKTLAVHFSIENSLINFSKFECSLPAAEQFVRNLHPGSILAASQKRKKDLELIDPRCSISISVMDGREHIEIMPKEDFSFTTKMKGKNVQAWTDFWERGAKLALKEGDFEVVGAPILDEILAASGGVEIQYGNEHPGALHVISKVEPGTIIPIGGHFRAGSKFITFQGQLANSPLEISFETTFQAAEKAEAFQLSVGFSPSKWSGQRLLSLSYLDQIVAFARAFLGEHNPEMQIFITGNLLVKGEMEGRNSDVFQKVANTVEWFEKCRWIARNYKVNPVVPDMNKLTAETMETVEELYELLKNHTLLVPSPNFQLPCFAPGPISEEAKRGSDRVLRIEKPEQTIDFFGTPVRLGPTLHTFTEMDLVSEVVTQAGEVQVIFAGTKDTIRTSFMA